MMPKVGMSQEPVQRHAKYHLLMPSTHPLNNTLRKTRTRWRVAAITAA